MKTETVTLKVQLPADLIEEARETEKRDPGFLSRVVLYGLTRRAIYRGIRDRSLERTG